MQSKAQYETPVELRKAQEPVPLSPLTPLPRQAAGVQSKAQYETPVGLRKAHEPVPHSPLTP